MVPRLFAAALLMSVTFQNAAAGEAAAPVAAEPPAASAVAPATPVANTPEPAMIEDAPPAGVTAAPVAKPGAPAAAAAPVEPPIDPEKLADTREKLREHAHQMFAIWQKEPDQNKKAILNQMITDCGFMLRFADKKNLKYTNVDKEEKKLAAMLADGQLTDAELSEWRKDMSTVIKTGPHDPLVFAKPPEAQRK